jgi:hypothetical protein
MADVALVQTFFECAIQDIVQVPDKLRRPMHPSDTNSPFRPCKATKSVVAGFEPAYLLFEVVNAFGVDGIRPTDDSFATV